MKSESHLSINTLILLKKVFNVLKKKHRLYLFLVLFIMFISAIMQSFSVLIFGPFFSLLLNQSNEVNSNINILFLNLKINTLTLSEVGFLVIIFLILSTGLQIINLRFYTDFYKKVISNISRRLYRTFTSLSYEEHIQMNSSKYINLTTLQIENSAACINLILQFFTSFLLCISLVISLLVVNFRVGFLTLIIFGFIYYILSIRNRKSINRNSIQISNLTRDQIKCVQESYASKRDLIIYQLNEFYLDSFAKKEFSIRSLKTNNILLSNTPRFFIEGFSLFIIVIISLVLINKEEISSTASISILGTFALASQKLIYNLQKLYSCWVNFKFRSDSLNEVLDNVDSFYLKNNLKRGLNIKNKKENFNFNFQKSIILDNINYSYKDNDFSLKNVNLKINKGEIIGILGQTGCGKSTLQDILIGLLKPKNGSILIDGIPLDYENEEFMRKWYSLICHVPQSIYMSDDTIRNNICAGKFKSQNLINMKKAAKCAMINDFIEKLPLGYETRMGENGILLSGGQRQRIGIARAIYNNPSILFLDEATSALDNKTEDKVMQNIRSIPSNPTIIIIAHRLNTLKHCDNVYEISNGEINKVDLNYYIKNLE